MKKRNIKDFCPDTYVAPAVCVVDIVSEGVLCASGLDINDWEKDDDVLDFV